jgi:tetratricopeptide (TPR) repeat protein
MTDEVIRIVKTITNGTYELVRGEKTFYCIFDPETPESIVRGLSTGVEFPLSIFKQYAEDGYFEYLKKEEPPELEDKADRFYQDGDYNKAIEVCAYLIEQKPYAYIYNLRGKAYFERGMYSEAIDDFNKAIAILGQYPSRDETDLFVSSYETRGRIYFKLGEHDKAVADFDKALKRINPFSDSRDDPESDEYVEICRNLGMAMQKQGGHGEAIVNYYINYQSHDWFNKLYSRAEAYIQDGTFDRADEDYEDLYRYETGYDNNDEGMITVRLTQAGMYLKYEHYEQAITWYNKAFNKALNIEYLKYINDKMPSDYALTGEWEEHEWDRNLPDDWEVTPEEYIERRKKEIREELKQNFISHNHKIYLDRGKVYFQSGDIASAIQDFEQVLKIKPDNTEAKEWLEKANNDYYDHAITVYTKDITLNPNDADAYKNRGNAYYGKDNYNSAIADYTQAISLNLNFAKAYNNRGVAYCRKGDYNSAISDFNQAALSNPNYVQEYCERATTCFNKGDYNLAIVYYTPVIMLNPNDAEAYYKRADAYYRKGDYDCAFTDYTQAITLNPNDAEAYHKRADVYYRRGDYNHAIEDWTHVIKIQVEYVYAYSSCGKSCYEAYNLRGKAYFEVGKYSEAINDFSKAISNRNKFYLNIFDELDESDNYIEIYLGRGKAYFQSRDMTSAIQDFEQVLKIEPDNTEAKEWLERAKLVLAKIKEKLNGEPS